jgi:ABC-type bacteriocin/lantibiotic exporter with double-glycine peptidase domain
MICVKQYNKHASLAACLESFLKDHSIDFEHETFIKTNLHLFNKEESLEGSYSESDLPQIASLLNLGFQKTNHLPKEHKKEETYLLVTHWNNDKTSNHVVRFESLTDDHLWVMEPMQGIMTEMDTSWLRGIYKLSILK